MIVKCPSCASKFRVPEERVRSEGVMVRCSRCKKVFRVRRSNETEATVRRVSPLTQSLSSPAPPLGDSEATRVVRDPLGEAGIPDDLSGAVTDPGHLLDDRLGFDLARDIPDPLLDIPFTEVSVEPFGGRSPLTPSGHSAPPIVRANQFMEPAGSETQPTDVDENDLSSLLSLAFPKDASAEPGEADLAVLEARTMQLTPMDKATLGVTSPLDGLSASFDESITFDPHAESGPRTPARQSFAPAVDDEGVDIDLDIELEPRQPESGDWQRESTGPRPGPQQPTPLPPEARVDIDDFPEPSEPSVASSRGTAGALSGSVPAVGAAPLTQLTIWLSSLVGVLTLALVFLLFLAARNDWLLDLGDIDQMLGVAFQGDAYQPRFQQTIRVYQLGGELVEEPAEPVAPADEPPPQPLRVQNVEQRLYETEQDVHLMIIEGDLVNASPDQQRRIFVRARLTADGSALADTVAPVGRNLTQEELERVATPESLQTIYDRVAQEAVELVLNPNQRSRFTAVFPRLEGAWLGDDLVYTVDVVEAQAAHNAGEWHRTVFDPSRLEAAPQ